MRVALLSPYHDGSHKYWADGLTRHSSHEFKIFSMPARFWKWRMHGAAITLADEYVNSSFAADVFLATDMLDLSTFLSLTRRTTAFNPAILYMHENQLTYPLPKDPDQGPMRRQAGERDLHFGFVNYVSMLAADAVMFNSEFHRESLIEELPRFLKQFPEYHELRMVDSIVNKSSVLYPGLELSPGINDAPEEAESPPLIIWNQRWEYDKDPETMFDVLYKLAERNLPFNVAICGQNFRVRPEEFEIAREKLAGRIAHFGYAEPGEYRRLLRRSHITFSTAQHEFFGIAVLEAVASEAFPVLPNRLSYPEIIPAEFHSPCLYSTREQLLERLEWALTNRDQARSIAADLAETTSKYQWSEMAQKYDKAIEAVAGK